MAYETLDDIVEELADELGIYGSHAVEAADDQCECRCCWTSDMARRIRFAFAVDKAVEGITLNPSADCAENVGEPK